MPSPSANGSISHTEAWLSWARKPVDTATRPRTPATERSIPRTRQTIVWPTARIASGIASASMNEMYPFSPNPRLSR